MNRLKFKIDNFLVGFPYGLMGKIIQVEEHHIGHYTLWDKVRYRLLVGKNWRLIMPNEMTVAEAENMSATTNPMSGKDDSHEK